MISEILAGVDLNNNQAIAGTLWQAFLGSGEDTAGYRSWLEENGLGSNITDVNLPVNRQFINRSFGTRSRYQRVRKEWTALANDHEEISAQLNQIEMRPGQTRLSIKEKILGVQTEMTVPDENKGMIASVLLRYLTDNGADTASWHTNVNPEAVRQAVQDQEEAWKGVLGMFEGVAQVNLGKPRRIFHYAPIDDSQLAKANQIAARYEMYPTVLEELRAEAPPIWERMAQGIRGMMEFVANIPNQLKGTLQKLFGRRHHQTHHQGLEAARLPHSGD